MISSFTEIYQSELSSRRMTHGVAFLWDRYKKSETHKVKLSKPTPEEPKPTQQQCLNASLLTSNHGHSTMVIKAFSHSASSLPHLFPAKHAVFLYFSFIFIVHHPVCVLSAIDVIASKPESILLVWLHGSSRFLLIHQE